MKKTFKLFLVTFCFILLMGFTGVYAQITDEKNIPTGYIPIYNISDLYAINNNLNGKYILMKDIDMSETTQGGAWDFGYGWRPIGYSSDNRESCKDFTGVLDGNGHRISNLNIYGYIPFENVGLFGSCKEAKISNTALENVNIDIHNILDISCGGMVGSCSYCEISGSYISGTIIVGKGQLNNKILNYEGNDYKYYSDEGNYVCIYIEDNYNKEWYFEDIYGNIDNGFVVEELLNRSNINSGGFSGNISSTKLVNCYSLINIYSDNAGCLAGSDIYTHAGYCYAIGSYSGNNTDYLCPSNCIIRNDNFYYLKTKGSSKLGTGLSETQMKTKECFTNFDFEATWFIDKNSSYPYPQLRKCPQVRVESVQILTMPNKVSYGLKETFDPAGGKVKITYEDDYSVTIPMDECQIYCVNWKKGVQTVEVYYFDKYTTFEIEVGKEPLELTIMAEASELLVGEEFTFEAEYTGSETIKYSSSNSKILSINSKTGDAKGIKAGSVIVTITAGELSKEIEVKVVKSGSDTEKTDKNSDNGKKTGTAKEDDVDPDFELEVGETFKLAIKKISTRKLSSSDKSIVTISKKGKVKAIAPGTATITIKDKSTKKVVEKYTVVVLSEEEPDFEIETGETMRIALKSGYTMKSSNENVLSVGSKGKVTGVKPGVATITVYDKSGKDVEKYLVEVTK